MRIVLSMFWGKDKKQEPKKYAGKRPQGTSCVGREGQRSDSSDIRAQALANARAARENLGEDTINKIAEIMKKMESQPMKQAQKKLESVDSGRVLDELRFMIDNEEVH